MVYLVHNQRRGYVVVVVEESETDAEGGVEEVDHRRGDRELEKGMQYA